MLIFKDYLLRRLPDYIIANDSYPDGSGKGFVQRYLEIFGEELDDYYYGKIVDLEKEFSPLSVTNPDYLDYFATMMGDLPRYLTNNDDFARVLTFILSIYKAKGTAKSLIAILGTLGFTSVVVSEYAVGTGIYDEDPITKYDTGLLYDDGCKPCSDFDVEITTSLPITAELFQIVNNLIELVRPINATLRNIIWNGDEVTAVFITVSIDGNGNLTYNNDNDPGLVLTLVNGDLIVSGPNAHKYFLDSNGDLYYID